MSRCLVQLDKIGIEKKFKSSTHSFFLTASSEAIAVLGVAVMLIVIIRTFKLIMISLFYNDYYEMKK